MITKINIGDIDVKRFYFDGVIKSKCPKCGTNSERDGTCEYISYPNIGDTIDFYCQECDEGWSPYKLKSITMEIEND